jgi:predicted nuclease with TOPRIM domain
MEQALASKPIRSKNIPVVQRHLELVRQELKADITTLRLEVKAGFQGVDSRFIDQEARFTSIDARFTDMEAKFTSIDSRFTDMEARFTAIDSRFTEMEARFTSIESRFTGIEGQLTGLSARFERIESILWGMKAMMEEQNTKILFALDGYNFLSAKVDRVENRIVKVEQKVFGTEQS